MVEISFGFLIGWQHSFSVHFLDFIGVAELSFVTLDLHRVCNYLSLLEAFRLKMNISGDFKALQTFYLTDFI